MYVSSSANYAERERERDERGPGQMEKRDVMDGRKPTLTTFPISLMGCDAPMKVLMRAELTRGDSVDISELRPYGTDYCTVQDRGDNGWSAVLRMTRRDARLEARLFSWRSAIRSRR